MKLAAVFLTLAWTSTALASSPLIISELRLRGQSGASDEFIEIYNASGLPHTVTGVSGGTGYAIAAADGVVRCVIPDNTVIPVGGHFLCTNSMSYSLSGAATGDATFTTDIPDNAGVALFNTTIVADFSLASRMDAVGSTSELNTLYKEGNGYSALTPFSINFAFVRDVCGKVGSITDMSFCNASAEPLDSDDNATDFYFVDTNGTSAGAGQRLGAAGPENLSSPLGASVLGGALLKSSLDNCAHPSVLPNRARDFTSDPANNSTFGTLDLRYTFTNNSGSALTRLRFRVVDFTTFPAPSNFADLRPRTSPLIVVNVDRAPCGDGTSPVNVAGTTLEQPPSQPNGGGFNSTLNVGDVTLATPLADGASIDLHFLMGIQQTGEFKLGLVAETLPVSTNGALLVEGNTDGSSANVVSIVRLDPNPTTASSVRYKVTFDHATSEVDATDFALDGVGFAGTAITGVLQGTGMSYTVSVNTGTGDGVLRLDLVDDDTIDPAVGGVGPTNGAFSGGEAYNVDHGPPSVTVNQGGADPTLDAPVFTATFTEGVSGLTGSDVSLSGSAGATTATVTGGPIVYTITVGGMTLNGSVIASLNAGAAVDQVSNPSNASTSSDNTIIYNGFPSVTSIVRANTTPTNAASVDYVATFNVPVTGVDPTDFSITSPGLAGVTVSGVSGSSGTYVVTVDIGSGDGTLQIAFVDDDSVSPPPLGTANGSSALSETYAIDRLRPSVTVEQNGNVDPTSATTVHFDVVFSEAVTGFADNDIVLSGTAGATTAVVTGGPTIYDVAVSGMTANGTVTASVNANAANDMLSNASTASTSVDNSITINGIIGVDAISRNDGDPTNAATVTFNVVFSSSVTNVSAGDFVLSTTGITGASVSGITGSGSLYTVTVNTGSGSGTLRLDFDDHGTVVPDPSGPADGDYTAGEVYTIDRDAPTVTIEQVTADPTTATTIDFTATFSEPVFDFTSADIVFGGDAGATMAVITGGPTVYNVAVSGMSKNGAVLASIDPGAAFDSAGNDNLASTSSDNIIFVSGIPYVTGIVRVGSNPTSEAIVGFNVTFSEAVTNVTANDFALVTSGLTGASIAQVTGGGTTYTVAVNSGTGIGTLKLNFADGGAISPDPYGPAGGSFTGGQTFTLDRVAPTVTIENAGADPTATSPINFTVTFSEDAYGFMDSGITLSGTAGATTAIVSGGPATYNVAVSGMTVNGTVIASVNAGAATDFLGNGNVASTSNDNSVAFRGFVDPPADLSIAITNPPTVNAGGSFAYTVSLENRGPNVASEVVVTVTLPSAVTFVSASGTGWTCGAAGNVVTCTVASLAVTMAEAITINATASSSAGSFSASVSASSSSFDPITTNNSDANEVSVTVVSPACGNGVVEGSEACDDGNTDNTDACLSTCVAATCGDGFVQAGVDQCEGAGTACGSGLKCTSGCACLVSSTTPGATGPTSNHDAPTGTRPGCGGCSNGHAGSEGLLLALLLFFRRRRGRLSAR